MNKGGLPKENDRNPAHNCPDIHRGKAIAATAGGIVVGGGLSALAIVVVTGAALFFISILWGIAIAFSAI